MSGTLPLDFRHTRWDPEQWEISRQIALQNAFSEVKGTCNGEEWVCEFNPDGLSQDEFFTDGPTEEELTSMKKMRDERRKHKVMLALESRKYLVDSGASLHLVNPNELTKDELKTKRKMLRPIPLTTAKGLAKVTHECLVHVKSLNITIWASLLKGSPHLLSQGKLKNENGFGYVDMPGDNPYLIKEGYPKVECCV